ncbi:hypothetical protein AAFF_G00394480 [Aldrovandia affinis]|uniref:Uncharacterized protein n=1 Tax=Aldrovandia affinis TaxID=143900 RepID=A0AAD7WLQ5_9TELE|nr:hypothetical protein AAFF_G00394480 [Aldrovandia affinis]
MRGGYSGLTFDWLRGIDGRGDAVIERAGPSGLSAPLESGPSQNLGGEGNNPAGVWQRSETSRSCTLPSVSRDLLRIRERSAGPGRSDSPFGLRRAQTAGKQTISPLLHTTLCLHFHRASVRDEMILVNSVSPSQPALLYENVVVSEGSPILRDLLFSPDQQHVYTLTDKQKRIEEQRVGGWCAQRAFKEPHSREPRGARGSPRHARHIKVSADISTDALPRTFPV